VNRSFFFLFFSRELFPTSEQSSENEITIEGTLQDVTKDTIKEENVTIPSLSTEETSVNDTQTLIESDQSESLPSLPIDDKINGTITANVNDQIPSPLSSPIKSDNEPSTIEKDISSEFFYDFQPEHFHAEQVRKNIFRSLNS
jgi:hypothetical protein